jgi:hypothetical protein
VADGNADVWLRPRIACRTCLWSLLIALIVVTACAGDDDRADERSSASETTASSAGETSTTEGTPATTAATDPAELSTEPRTTPAPESPAQLTRVSAERDGNTERVVFETTDGIQPGMRVRYVDAVRIEGEPLLVEGDAALEVVLEQANPNASEGLSPDVAVDLLPEQPLLREVRFARYLADSVTFAIGLADQAKFRVVREPDGGRLVIEFSSD